MEKELLFKTNDIGKIYGTNTVLQGINVEFHRGEIVGLIGENGAGKSTLMKIIAGVEEASMGTMEMNGKPSELPPCWMPINTGSGWSFRSNP